MRDERVSRKMFKLMGIDIDDLSNNRQWTQDGVSYLIDLYKLGWTADEMAEEMNRTPGSIVGKIYDLGEEGVLCPEMWGMDSRVRQFPKGPLGNVAIILPLVKLQ